MLFHDTSGVVLATVTIGFAAAGRGRHVCILGPFLLGSVEGPFGAGEEVELAALGNQLGLHRGAGAASPAGGCAAGHFGQVDGNTRGVAAEVL